VSEGRRKELDSSKMLSGPEKSVGVVDAVRLDEVIQRHVDVMKIDVEGFEPHVIAGAEKLLTTYGVDHIVLEYNMWRAMKASEGIAMLNRLSALGYVVYNADGPNMPLIPCSEFANMTYALKDERQRFRGAQYAINLYLTKTAPLTWQELLPPTAPVGKQRA
jgi:hypothetical protein